VTSALQRLSEETNCNTKMFMLLKTSKHKIPTYTMYI